MHARSRFFFLSLALPACHTNSKNPSSVSTETAETIEDADGDGVPSADDCDDTDPSSTILAEDADCDGILTADDCDDTDPAAFPGAPESLLGPDLACDGTGGSLAYADYAFIGEARDDWAGTSVRTAGDVDGDGLDDVIVGAPGNGNAYLVFGRTLAAGVSSTINLGDADLTFIGEESFESAGKSVGPAGDVDGDGLDDLLIGAPNHQGDGDNIGKAYLLLGRSLAANTTGTISLRSADFAFVGETDYDYAGTSVSPAGDVDGDGLDDLLLGAPSNPFYGDPPGAGRAYLLLGRTLAASTSSTINLRSADFVFMGENSGDWAGYSVSAAGDVDGDGLSDLLVGAPYNADARYNAGKSYVIFGSTIAAHPSSTIDLQDADLSFVGENTGDEAGKCVSPAGDVDGDGLDDLLVGADGNREGGSAAGKAYLFLGSTLAARTASTIQLTNADFAFIGENADDRAGASVSPAGDVDGDGLDDLFVGAYGNDDGGAWAGKAYLLLGSTLTASTSSTIDLSQADFAFTGESSEDNAGTSVAGGGDVNGDGRDDLLVGAPDNDDGGTNAGKAYLLLSHL